MRWLSDSVLGHLCRVADWPDLSGTKYEPIEKLGQGGMASVYLAKDRELDRTVALKVLSLAIPDPPSQQRLAEEARIIARLEHPGIVPVHDSGILPDGRVFYAMKWVRGQRLDEYARGSHALAELLRIFEKICQTVAFAHAHGVIHRDLKPQNIMVGAFGEVLVMDWGVAKLRANDPMHSAPDKAARSAEWESFPTRAGTAQGTVLGTPGFMAPEQARGDLDGIDQRTDVYALGATLYDLLTGQAPQAEFPYDRPSANGEAIGLLPPRQLNRSIPLALEAICLKAMAQEPADRYASVQELADDIARFLAQVRVKAYPEGIFGVARRLASKNRTAIVLILAYLAMRFLLLVWSRI